MFKNYKEYLREVNSMFWPLVLTFTISNALQIIDTMMLTNYNEVAVAGVSSVSQFMMTIGPVFFAILSGIGIFSSQYYGARQYDDLKKTFGLNITSSILFAIIGFLLILIYAEEFIRFFTKDDIEALSFGMEYARVYKYVMFLYPINFAFTFSYRSIKLTKYPMYVNIPMVIINTLLNYVLIYGKFGLPVMGAEGAAIATLISYVVALGLNILLIIKLDLPLIGTIKEMFSYDYKFVKPIIIKTIPIVISEFLFGSARLLYTKAFALLGTSVFIGERIANNLTMFVNSFVFASANTCGSVIGTTLGAMKCKEDVNLVKNKANFLLLSMTVISTSIFMLCWFGLPYVVSLYGAESKEVYDSAVILIKMNGIFAGLRTFSSSILFILRAGGDMLYATIIDSGLAWVIGIPLTFLSLHLFDLDIRELKAITLVENFAKAFLALYRFRTMKWIKKVI